MNASDNSRRPRFVLFSLAVAILWALGLLATSPGLPLVWDEGNAILRAEGIADGQWRYTTELEGHPALYGIVIALGQSLGSAWLDPLSAARLGPIVLFSVAAGAMFWRLARDYSPMAALAATAALATLPRLLAHAHFASFDGPLSACWMLAWATFPTHGANEMARPARAAIVLWGVALGMTLSCKATGWIAPLPFLIWTVLYDRRAVPRLTAIGLPVALAVFAALNPPLWPDPLGGLVEFLTLNFHRGANSGLNIAVLFLGRMYNLEHPLPWYNTLVWTAVTVPLAILVLAGAGVIASWLARRRDRRGMLLVFNWLVLLVVRALPGVPPHDGVRLFLPSFAFLAALAGLGCHALLTWVDAYPRCGAKARRLTVAALVLLLGTAAVNLYVYRPQWLSYYNLLIGGLPGATARGMEATYYWDALDRPVLDWLNRHTGDDEKIRFGAISPENLTLLARWKVLHPATTSEAPGRWRWYVLQRRPSGYRAEDLWLLEHAQAAYRRTLLGVPLVEVYDIEDYRRARRALRGQTSGDAGVT